MGAAVMIDEFSCSSVMIIPRFKETALSGGTGFIVGEEQMLFLITNWHNVTGRNPITGKHLSSMAAEPDALAIVLHHKARLGTHTEQIVRLHRSNGEPTWYEHPTHRSQVDVVALELDVTDDAISYPINKMPQSSDMRIQVGQDLFILGFPFGLNTGGFPVWKRASIATEPQLSVDGLPKFLVDTASRPGMSGSPVITRTFGSYQSEDGAHVISSGTPTKFVGVYSGRIGAEDELKAQLGIIWRSDVIKKILEAKVVGSRVPVA